jgi:hypothetical protein
MNIEWPMKTKILFIALIVVTLVNLSIPLNCLSQEADSIVAIDQHPEKLLAKIRLSKIEDGFNFWQDNFSGHWAGIDIGFNSFLNPDYSA